MEPIPYPDIILEELARILNLWAENEWVTTTEDTLVAWARTSASRTPRPPVALAGIHLMQRMMLVDLNSYDLMTPSRIVVDGYEPVEYLDAYSRKLALIVFDRLYALPEFTGELASALEYVRFGGADLTVDWRMVRRDDQSNVAWVWLQQLGLAQHHGHTVTCDSSLSAFVADASVSRRRMSQEELDARLVAQKRRSDLAEEFVLRIERERLAAAGADEYLDGVIRVSIEDVEAGYDIQSYETNGEQRKIEVKSSVGPRRFFIFSINEIETARRLDDNYWLAWVSSAERLPTGPCDVAWFRNPVLILESANSPWAMRATEMMVSIISDDSGYVFPLGK